MKIDEKEMAILAGFLAIWMYFGRFRHFLTSIDPFLIVFTRFEAGWLGFEAGWLELIVFKAF